MKLTGSTSNQDGGGARVKAEAVIADQLLGQIRTISDANTGGGVNGPIAHFGLGNATKVDTLRIEWPSGIVQELQDVTPNQILTVTVTPRLNSQGAGAFTIQCWINQVFDVQASTDLTA